MIKIKGGGTPLPRGRLGKAAKVVASAAKRARKAAKQAARNKPVPDGRAPLLVRVPFAMLERLDRDLVRRAGALGKTMSRNELIVSLLDEGLPQVK